ncbi:UNVERIFIED_CONTAM: para [Trichonephila clavipes]
MNLQGGYKPLTKNSDLKLSIHLGAESFSCPVTVFFRCLKLIPSSGWGRYKRNSRSLQPHQSGEELGQTETIRPVKKCPLNPRNAHWVSIFAKSVLSCCLLHKGNLPTKFQFCRFNSSGDIVISHGKEYYTDCQLIQFQGLRAKVTNQIADQTTESGDGEDPPVLIVDGQVPSKDKKSPKEKTELEIALDGYEVGYQEDGKAIKMKNKSNSMVNSVRMGDKVQPKDNKEMEKEVFGNKVHPQKEEDNLSNKSYNGYKDKGVTFEKPSKETSRSSQNNDSDDEKKDASKEDLGEDVLAGTDIQPHGEGEVDTDKLETEAADVIIAEYPADCCPDFCYKKFACCAEEYNPEFWEKWKNLRSKTYILIEDKYFETIIITMIMISSLALAAEDVNLKYRPGLESVLTYMDKVFTVLFFFEMLIKWLALGFRKYFQNAWCWLDFVIVLVSNTFDIFSWL